MAIPACAASATTTRQCPQLAALVWLPPVSLLVMMLSKEKRIVFCPIAVARISGEGASSSAIVGKAGSTGATGRAARRRAPWRPR